MKVLIDFFRIKDVVRLARIKDLLSFFGIEDLPAITLPESRIP